MSTNVNLNLGIDTAGLGGTGFQNSISPIYANPIGIGGPSSGGGDQILQMEQEIMQLLQQMMQLLQQMEGGQGGLGLGGGSGLPGLGGGSGSGLSGGSLPIADNTQMMQDATFSSWGDPHQNFSGTGMYGAGSMSGHSDNMGSINDLIDANSAIDGGYQVNTQTTAPNSNGITYNASATVAMNGGATTVTMGKDGNVSIMDNGNSISLQKGQSIELSNGATVSESQDGKVTVSDQNDQGGSISTTLSWNGAGVDVNGSAHDIALGGYDVGLGQSQTQNNSLLG